LLNNKLDCIINKLSLDNGILELSEARLWVPNAPRDLIQNIQLSTYSFFEQDILQGIDNYLDKNSVILDLGANVGNHTVYWGKITKVKRIYSFEPVKATFKILSKNIEINNLTDRVNIYNIGLGDKDSKGSIKGLYNVNASTIADSIGSLSINESIDGDIDIKKLDTYNEIIEEEKIDFVKIDVEGYEKKLLLGAVGFFKKHKPAIFIESFPGTDNYDFVKEYFQNRDYLMPIKYPGNNYLYIHKSYNKNIGIMKWKIRYLTNGNCKMPCPCILGFVRLGHG